MRRRLSALACLLAVSPTALAAGHKERSYRSIVMSVADMVNDGHAQELVAARGLNLLNVMWEDTGRWEGSSVGPNISDVTIEVQMEDAKGRLQTALMPVIRYPNFSDLTGDVKMDSIRIPIGNQHKDGQLETISLTELLKDPTRYMTLPDQGKIKTGTLLSKRDSHVLVSAQAAFLPVPRAGKAVFWPVIFNYQSTKAQPAVLSILVTRQGTSMTIIDNARDSIGGDWGQRLFFNAGGQRAPFTAERLSDVKEKGVTMNGESAASLGDDANLLMLIQVPLKIRQVMRPPMDYAPATKEDAMGGAGMAPPAEQERTGRRDMETAVLGHGPELGPFVELAGKTIARDPRFPVRVTVQFYQATATGQIGRAEVAALQKQIRKVYKQADYVGSLVVPTARDRERPTMWDGFSKMPIGTTWRDFPGIVERFKGVFGS
jgi:hypothetical protein